MKINTAEFVMSNQDITKCPIPQIPEYAFIGRSNVGKSSLINMLSNVKNLAKTSSKPGKTRLINHFIMNKSWYLVDLPGYGFSKMSVDKKKNLFWGLGCGYELHNSDTLIWHWGNNWNTFRSVFVYSLNEQKGYVLLTNSENGHRVLQELNRSMFNKTLQFPKWLGYKQTTIANKT